MAGPAWGEPGPADPPATDDVAASGAAGVLAPAPQPAEAKLLGPRVGPPTPSRRYRLVRSEGEFRGAWLHWQDFCGPAQVRRTVIRARRAGLNALLPLANYPYQAMWRSRTIPVNPRLPDGFDPLGELAREAHAAGIQVHPYLCSLNGGLAKHPNFTADWFAVDPNGRRVGNWLNPGHPEVRTFLARLVAELVDCGVDGVHLDYLRHEYDSDYDYSAATRQAFFDQYGFDPLVLRRGPAGGTGMRLLRTAWHRGEGRGSWLAQQTFLRAAGYVPAAVDEADLGKLRRETLVVCGDLTTGHVQGSTIDALLDHVASGGAAIVLEGPEITVRSRRLAAALGLDGLAGFNGGGLELRLNEPGHPVAAGVPPVLSLRPTGKVCPTLDGAQALATFADGRPAVTVRHAGQGLLLVFNFRCFAGQAAQDEGVQRLLANAVDWLCEQRGIPNTARVGGARIRNPEAVWDRWRMDQVTSLVAELSNVAHDCRPDIVVSAAGGCQREDLTRVRRDGLTWLKTGSIDFLCPMAYTRDNDLLRRRLRRELDPLDAAWERRALFAGLGVYKMTDAPQRVVEQIEIARQMGFGGVCLFAFEHLTDTIIAALAAGPFQQPARVPWELVPAAE